MCPSPTTGSVVSDGPRQSRSQPQEESNGNAPGPPRRTEHQRNGRQPFPRVRGHLRPDGPADELRVRPAPGRPGRHALGPALADLSETDDAYLVKAELPGVNKDQVNVQLQDREIVISGEIPEPETGDGKGEGTRRHHGTRRTGRFELRTYLPGDVNADAVAAQLSDGILTVTIPKSEAAKPRKIEITG